METKLNKKQTFRRGLDLTGIAHSLRGFLIKEEVEGRLFAYGLQNVENPHSPLQYSSIRKGRIENQHKALDICLTHNGFLVEAYLYDEREDVITPEELLFLHEIGKHRVPKVGLRVMRSITGKGLLGEYDHYKVSDENNQELKDKQIVRGTIDCLMDKYYFIVDTLCIRERLGEELLRRGNKYASLVWSF